MLNIQPKGQKLVFDIEADNLLRDATTMFVLRTEDIDTGEKCRYIACQGDSGWIDKLSSASLVIGHNICGYDLPLLEKLYNFRLPTNVKVRDTFVMSIVLDYMRFGSHKGHGLGNWGEALGYSKGDFEDFSKYSEEMDVYCERDVSLNVKVYRELEKELKIILASDHGAPYLITYLKSEQAVARWQAIAQANGWPFDIEKALKLKDDLKKILDNIQEKLEAVLGLKAKIKDRMPDNYRVVNKWVEMVKEGNSPYADQESLMKLSNLLWDSEEIIAEPKFPRWVKAGSYDSHTANWFNIDPWEGYLGESQPIAGPYSRLEIVPLKLTSPSDVKIFLYRNGWEPSEWNTKPDPYDNKKRIKTSPKIADDDLELLGGDGALYSDFKSFSSRHNVLTTWCKEYRNGVLHGDSFVIGTPSMRTRHQIIANVPTSEKPYGTEMRELFTCTEKELLVGGDSSGNQARALAFYIGDEEYTNTVVHGDIHTYNANALTSALQKMGIDYEVPRNAAKRILYAFLFGASGGKHWSYIFGVNNKQKGNKLKNLFTKAVPGFGELVESQEKIFSSTKKFGYGYIYGIAGNRIYVDSYHKLLVYLLQACEKATCAAAVMLTMERLEAEGIPYTPCIMYHDEENMRVAIEHSKRTAEIVKQAFIDGPKLFGIQIMDGDAKIGKTWLEIH